MNQRVLKNLSDRFTAPVKEGVRLERFFRQLLKEELDHRGRVSRLDSAMLFLASATSLAFALIQTLLTTSPTFIFIIPGLLLGWFAPFYIGYIHGAIKNNPVNRIRGWTYLTMGSISYVILSIFSLFIVPLLVLDAALGVFIAIGCTLPFIITGMAVTSSLNQRISRICNHYATPVEQKVVNSTRISSTILALALSIAVCLEWEYFHQLQEGILLFRFFVYTYVLIGLFFELYVWYLMRYKSKSVVQ